MSAIFEVTNLVKYYGTFMALRDISLRVEPGTIGLLGPNGAGKTTLIKVLLGLLPFERGQVKVLGLNTKNRAKRIREQIGFMPEVDCHIAGFEAIRMVAYAGEMSGLPPIDARKRAHEVLDYIGIGDERYREVQTLSAGMKQKIKLAQALVHDPKLLFLDEPTTGLDPEGREHMLALIRDLATRSGISIVFSSHLLPDVESICETIIIMGKGRVLRHDRLDILKRAKDPSLLIRVRGQINLFKEELSRQGIGWEQYEDGTLKILKERGDVEDLIIETACRYNIQIRHLAPNYSTLEQIFLTAVREVEQGSDNVSI